LRRIAAEHELPQLHLLRDVKRHALIVGKIRRVREHDQLRVASRAAEIADDCFGRKLPAKNLDAISSHHISVVQSARRGKTLRVGI